MNYDCDADDHDAESMTTTTTTTRFVVIVDVIIKAKNYGGIPITIVPMTEGDDDSVNEDRGLGLANKRTCGFLLSDFGRALMCVLLLTVWLRGAAQKPAAVAKPPARKWWEPAAKPAKQKAPTAVRGCCDWLRARIALHILRVLVLHVLVGCRVSGVGCRVLGVGCRVSGVGCC